MTTVSELRTRHAALAERRARAEGAAETAQREYDSAMVVLRDEHGCHTIEELDARIDAEREAVATLMADAEAAMSAAEGAQRDA